MPEVPHDRNVRMVANGKGAPIVLRPVEEPLPVPGRGEVRVRIGATGVAMADILMREGVYPGTTFPLTPGYDVVGTVDALGPETDDSTPIGTRVVALTVTGGYARYACFPQRHCVATAHDVDDAKTVATVLNYLTAYQMLHRCCDLEPGATVLVHGAAGGVGTAVLQLGALAGLRILGTASKDKHDLVRRLGGEPIDYANEDFVERAKALGGVDAVLDAIGGAHWSRSLAALRTTGTLVAYGSSSVLSGGRLNPLRAVAMLLGSPRPTPLDLLGKSQAIVGYNVTLWRDARPATYRRDLAHLMTLLADGGIDPVVDVTMPLTSAPEAHERLGNARASGKIVLVP